jgi:Cu(I)/Ag(I) efflux system protein CusF
MKSHTIFSAAALAAAVLFATPAQAQMNMDHGKKDMNAQPIGMTEGEVRKIDKDAGKITIKHGEIQHMGMPPMTMVFAVKDKALLDKTGVGAKIRFMAVHENGQMLVTDIQNAP